MLTLHGFTSLRPAWHRRKTIGRVGGDYCGMTSTTDGADTIGSALEACARQDEAALKHILDVEGGRLLGVAQRMLRRRDLAEEAVQDTFVQIWRKAHQYSAEGGSARGWIYAILRNRCLSILRDGQRLSTLEPEDLAAIQDARQYLAASEAWRGLGGGALRDCLAQLDAPSRQSILLAYVAGFTHGEIAVIQKVPLGTAKSWVRRGLSALRGCLS